MFFRFLIFCIKWFFVVCAAYYIYTSIGKDRVDSVVSEVKEQASGVAGIPKKF